MKLLYNDHLEICTKLLSEKRRITKKKSCCYMDMFLVSCGVIQILPRSVMMQPKIAKRAPVLRPVEVYATAPHDKATPSESQSHTRTESVLVLLRAGLPLSTINTGRRYIGCSRLRKPPRFVSMDAVLSAETEEKCSLISHRNKSLETIFNCRFIGFT